MASVKVEYTPLPNDSWCLPAVPPETHLRWLKRVVPSFLAIRSPIPLLMHVIPWDTWERDEEPLATSCWPGLMRIFAVGVLLETWVTWDSELILRQFCGTRTSTCLTRYLTTLVCHHRCNDSQCNVSICVGCYHQCPKSGHIPPLWGRI